MSTAARERTFRSPETPRVEYARTPDDWDLALHRYPGAREELPPAILCPGFGCNRYFLDFDDRYSLARFLARQGFEVWVLELRGRGYSEPVLGRRGRGWTFDDLAQHDFPTAVRHVCGRSGRAPVWVGHSMGGLVAYAALGQNPELQSAVRGLVTMASPVAFPAVPGSAWRRAGELLLRLPGPARLPQRNLLVALWSLMAVAPWFPEIGMNRSNLDQRAFGRALSQFICNVAREKVQQFAHWSVTGRFCSRDGKIDYRANLKHVSVPALLIAGAADRLAPPEVVGWAHAELGSRVKELFVAGRAAGLAANYGHVDLVFGHRAPEEIFPRISCWIAAQRQGA